MIEIRIAINENGFVPSVLVGPNLIWRGKSVLSYEQASLQAYLRAKDIPGEDIEKLWKVKRLEPEWLKGE